MMLKRIPLSPYSMIWESFSRARRKVEDSAGRFPPNRILPPFDGKSPRPFDIEV